MRTDYANAGVPMLPVVAGAKATRLQILLYTLPMAAAAVAPWALGPDRRDLRRRRDRAQRLCSSLLALRVATQPRGDRGDAMGPRSNCSPFRSSISSSMFGALVADRLVLA